MTEGSPPLALDTVVFARRLRTLGDARPSLAPMDLDILPGEIFAVVGRAGSGKSALLEGLVGLRPVAADQLSVCGTDPRRFAPAVKERIGVAPCGASVERHLTVEEALTLFGASYERRVTTASILETMDLVSVRQRPVQTLPPSVARRFSLARALYAHVVDNTVGYRRWRRPYVEGLGADPWGARYGINVGCLTAAGTDYVTIVMSPGPNGVVDAAFRAKVLPARQSDDVIGLVSTGKDGGAAPAGDAPGRIAGVPTTPVSTNLCTGTGAGQPRNP